MVPRAPWRGTSYPTHGISSTLANEPFQIMSTRPVKLSGSTFAEPIMCLTKLFGLLGPTHARLPRLINVLKRYLIWINSSGMQLVNATFDEDNSSVEALHWAHGRLDVQQIKFSKVTSGHWLNWLDSDWTFQAWHYLSFKIFYIEFIIWSFDHSLRKCKVDSYLTVPENCLSLLGS